MNLASSFLNKKAGKVLSQNDSYKYVVMASGVVERDNKKIKNKIWHKNNRFIDIKLGKIYFFVLTTIRNRL